MSPNGRKAWRDWVRRNDLRRKYKQPKGSVCRMARQARRHIPLVPGVVLPNHFTARSLVGMSQKARKRLRHDRLFGPNVAPTKLLLADSLTVQLHIGERLRPCPGCCACWGCSAVTILGEITECCGPKTRGKSRRQIRAMRKWEARMWDDCDGSGVLPARACLHRGIAP